MAEQKEMIERLTQQLAAQSTAVPPPPPRAAARDDDERAEGWRMHLEQLQGQLSRATADLEYLGVPCPDFGEDPAPPRGGWEDDVAYMRAKGSELRRRIKIASEAVTEARRNRPATPPRAPAAKRPRTDTVRCIHGYCGATSKFRMASELDRLGM